MAAVVPALRVTWFVVPFKTLVETTVVPAAMLAPVTFSPGPTPVSEATLRTVAPAAAAVVTVVMTVVGTTRPPRKLVGIEVPVVKPVGVTAVVFNVRVLAAPENPIFAVATQAVVPVPGCTPRA